MMKQFLFLLLCCWQSSCYAQVETEVMSSVMQMAVEGAEQPSPIMYAKFYITTANDSLFVYSAILGKKGAYKIKGYVAKDSFYFIQMDKKELVLEYEREVGVGQIKGAFWIDKANNYSLYLYAQNDKKL